MFMDLDSVSVHKHANKRLGQYPAILTEHLVNNPYILKPIVTRSSRPPRQPPVFSSSFDWLTAWIACDWPKWLLWFQFNDTRLKTALLGTKTKVGTKTRNQDQKRVEKKNCVFLQVYWNIHGHNQHLHQNFDHYGILQHPPKEVA